MSQNNFSQDQNSQNIGSGTGSNIHSSPDLNTNLISNSSSNQENNPELKSVFQASPAVASKSVDSLKLYIYENIAKTSKDEIYKNLLFEGYKLDEIEHFFNKIQQGQNFQGQVGSNQSSSDLNTDSKDLENQDLKENNFHSQNDSKTDNSSQKSSSNSLSKTPLDTTSNSISDTLTEQTNTPKLPKHIYVVAILGSILIGLGFLSLVAANWATMTDFAKVFTISGFMIFFYTLGLFMYYFGIKWISELLMLIGCFIFGANLFLISQIYNLPINWQDGFLYWFSGSLWIALSMNQKIVAIASFLMLIAGLPGFLAGYFNPFNVFSEVSDGMSYLAISVSLISSIWASYVFSQGQRANFQQLLAKQDQK